MGDGLQSPYHNAVAPTPSGADTGGGGTSGGYDLPDGRKETSNMSGLPPLPTTVGLGQGEPGVNTQVPVPPVESPGTIPS